MTQLNGCHNKPRPVAGKVTHLAQNGYTDRLHEGWGVFSRRPVYVEIKHVMTTDCQYSKTTQDPRCAGCTHHQGAV